MTTCFLSASRHCGHYLFDRVNCRNTIALHLEIDVHIYNVTGVWITFWTHDDPEISNRFSQTLFDSNKKNIQANQLGPNTQLMSYRTFVLGEAVSALRSDAAAHRRFREMSRLKNFQLVPSLIIIVIYVLLIASTNPEASKRSEQNEHTLHLRVSGDYSLLGQLVEEHWVGRGQLQHVCTSLYSGTKSYVRRYIRIALWRK